MRSIPLEHSREIGEQRRVPNVGPAEAHASHITKMRMSSSSSRGMATRVGIVGAPGLLLCARNGGGGGAGGGGDGGGGELGGGGGG